MNPEALAIQTALRQRIAVADQLFDRQYPRTDRYRSEVHWTPIEVALRVAQFLAPSPGGHILDVGAGVGKACIVGALTTPALWYGMERDPRRVLTARRVARRLGVEHRTSFLEGEATLMDWSPFGGFYLFNPFAESLFKRSILEPGGRRSAYIEEVARVERKLADARVDTRVVTYHGFGGALDEHYELVESEPHREGDLCLWIRRGPPRRATAPSEPID